MTQLTPVQLYVPPRPPPKPTDHESVFNNPSYMIHNNHNTRNYSNNHTNLSNNNNNSNNNSHGNSYSSSSSRCSISSSRQGYRSGKCRNRRNSSSCSSSNGSYCSSSSSSSSSSRVSGSSNNSTPSMCLRNQPVASPDPALAAAPCPSHPTNIPAHSITTLNLNSLSAHPTSSNSTKSKRHRNMIETITQLLRNNDILALQETHLGANDHSAISNLFPKHQILYNNYRLGQRGTMLIINKSILNTHSYQIFKCTGEHTKGRIQAVRFNPRASAADGHGALLPFLVLNVYLQADSNTAALSSQLRAIRRVPPCERTYLLGDFNFTESHKDSPSVHSSLLLSGSPLTLWTQVLVTHGLHEVRQPTHTHYTITRDIQKCRSSRIDRIYISHSLSDLTIVSPKSFIPHTRINILTSYKTATSGLPHGPIKTRLCSDHVPVSLKFVPTARSKKRAFNAPRWLADTAGFKERIMNLFGVYHDGESPFTALRRWKQAVKAATRDYFQEQRRKTADYKTKSAELSASIQLLRLCSLPQPNQAAIVNYLSRHTSLAPLLTDTSSSPINTDSLRNHIHYLLTDDLDTTDLQEQQLQNNPTLPDSSTPTMQAPSQNIIEDLKKTLPATREHLRMVRESPAHQPTAQPKEMARIIKGCWGKLWARSGDAPSYTHILRYLRAYPTRIPMHSLPLLPTYDVILEHIHASNNSAAGPDGIPFAMHRLCADTMAQILLDIVTAMSKGVDPPKGFNFARLFLIPKDDSMDISAHRPISVTNSDNRIIAKALARVITPALQTVLHPSQKGFVEGRQGADHIQDLNAAYYKAQAQRRQHYILFLDTRKAFDSIHHDFISAVLHVMGMPQWFCSVVQALLTDVCVIPVLGEETGVLIPIHRGVKQGCPLSPLLFVICYDVLLHLLDKADLHLQRLHQYAFADDLALSSPSLCAIISALKVVMTFAEFSGLGLNVKKTVILTSLSTFYSDTCLLRESGFGQIHFATEATYLGVLMGQDIGTPDIFQKAKEKFLRRLQLFRPVIYACSLHKRILIVNVFLLPIMFYLAQFFLIPYHEVIIPLKLAVHRAVVPFNGGGLGYVHIIAPRKSVGPHTPLRDLWASNMALLAIQFPNLNDSQGAPVPVMGEYDTVHTPVWDSLLISEHRAHAAFAYLELYGARDSNRMIDVSRLGSNVAVARRRIYNDLVDRGYLQERSSTLKRHPSSLPNKLRRTLRLPDSCSGDKAARHLRAHAASACTKVRPTIWNNFLRTIHNALPTDVRRNNARMEVKVRNQGPGSDFPCYLCGGGEDSYIHLLSECQVAKEALSRIGQAVNIHIQHSLNVLSLNFPPTSSNLPTMVILHFLSSLWIQRQFFATLASPPDPASAARRIIEHTLDRLMPKDPQQRISTSKAIAELALNPPDNAFVCFTDGSAIPNPGPTGAGIHGTLPVTRDNEDGSSDSFHLSVALGAGDNNLGEFYAIFAALRMAEALLSGCAHPPPYPHLH